GDSIGGSGGIGICGGGEDQGENGDAGSSSGSSSSSSSGCISKSDSGTYSGDWVIGEASSAYGWSSATISSSACSGPGI
nr:hypothetical protein [Tanacetum cinerariifolium]